MTQSFDYVAKPMPGLWQAIKGGFKNLFNFGGRMRRSEYWMFIAAVCVLYAGLMTGLYYLIRVMPDNDGTTMTDGAYWWAMLILTILFVVFLFIIPSFLILGATNRRLHDTGRSGLLAWLSFIGIVIIAINFAISIMCEDYQDSGDWFVWCVLGTCVLIMVTVVFCLKDSEKVPNRYGGSPKWEHVEPEAL